MTWNRIMVPTDGSDLSAQAFPLATELAQAQGAEVLLVQVVPLPVLPMYTGMSPGSGAVYQQVLDDARSLAESQLEDHAAQLRTKGLTVRTLLGEGIPAAVLLDVEQAEKPDLVVMGTHGRGGLSRFALGSVAERVVRDGACPTLVVRAPAGTGPSALTTALVLLDGSGLAEQVLPQVQVLAGRPIQAVKLFRVVSDPDDRVAARTYLEGVAARLGSVGLRCELQVDVGDPRLVIQKATNDVDLVMLSTHGRSGFDRWRHGSVAEFVVRQIDRPVLLVRVRESIDTAQRGSV